MSHRAQVMTAIAALVAAAASGVEVRGFVEDASKPERLPASGFILGDPGDPGEPEFELSPLAYIYSHRIPVEIWRIADAGADASIDATGAAIGAAIVANRSLSGLCEFLDCTALTISSDDLPGSQPLRVGAFDIIAEYTVTNPLG